MLEAGPQSQSRVVIDLTGKVAVVSGARTGIGREIGLVLAQCGADIIGNSRGDDQGFINLIEGIGRRARWVKGDIGERQTSVELMGVARELGGPHIVVADAGAKDDGAMIDRTDEAVERVMRTNFWGPWYLAQEGLNAMMPAYKEAKKQSRRDGIPVPDKDFGSFVYISSEAVRIGHAFQSVYVAAKAATSAFYRSNAAEYAPRGIRFNVVSPGYAETAMTESLSDETKEYFLGLTPDGRPVNLRGIAGTVAFLVSDLGRDFNGQVLSPNRGIVRD